MNILTVLFGKDPATTVTGYVAGVVFAWLHTVEPSLNEQTTLSTALTWALAALFALGGRLANERFAKKPEGE
jgi:hypothetical protein